MVSETYGSCPSRLAALWSVVVWVCMGIYVCYCTGNQNASVTAIVYKARVAIPPHVFLVCAQYLLNSHVK